MAYPTIEIDVDRMNAGFFPIRVAIQPTNEWIKKVQVDWKVPSAPYTGLPFPDCRRT